MLNYVLSVYKEQDGIWVTFCCSVREDYRIIDLTIVSIILNEPKLLGSALDGVRRPTHCANTDGALPELTKLDFT